MAAAVRVAAIHAAKDHGEKHKAPGSKSKAEKAPVRFYNGPFTGWRAYQPAMNKFYTYPLVEYFVAFLIVANFFISITEKWIDPMAGHMNPANRKFDALWNGIGLMFNILFLIELAVNMYAYWLWDFWCVCNNADGTKWSLNGWNCFDFIIVLVGWLDQLNLISGPLKLLRLMRAFRVFRLFKRIKSLQKIIVSLGRAVPGMINAMVIMLIVMSIYAMLGVEFFSHSFTPRVYEKESSVSGGVGYTDDAWIFDPESDMYRTADDKYECPVNLLDNETSTCYVTARGNGYAEEYFGNFGRSLYTLFQVLTGDSWSEAIARPMFEAEPIVTTLYFVSYVVFIAIILVNVVVAVLLEKMVDDGSDEEEEEEHYHHKNHDWVHPDAKATIGELWDLKQDIRAKHMVMQAQLDALTANIEALCAKQGVTPVTSEGLLAPPNEVAAHDDKGYFDEKGNRICETNEDGHVVEKVRSWVYTREEVDARLAEELQRKNSTKGSPAAGNAEKPEIQVVQVVNIEES